MNTTLRILFALLLLPMLASAQLTGRGKIISVQGDTLECIIEIQQKQFCDVVKYKKNKEDRFEKFPMPSLHKIIFKDKVYENVFIEKSDAQDGKIYTSKLCVCVVNGFVKLYKESITMFYHGAEGILNNNIKPGKDDVYYVIKGNGNAEEVNTLNNKFFTKQSKKMFVECPEIVDSIDEKKYNSNDIIMLVQQYNDFYASNRALISQK